MDKIGKYSIMEELGRGNTGVAYHVLDVESQRRLVMKVIKVNPELADDDPDLNRIIHATEEQCKKLSSIEHRNVARIFEAGFQNGAIYIAIELIEGSTLKWFMEDTGRVKVEEAVEIVKDIAKGLKAIHALGIVKGGLKPSDVIIRPGTPVIVGFGIPAELVMDLEGIVKVTKTVESVIYLAPEVIEGSEPTGKSDIYSLGMLLYTMLAGSNPFDAGTVANALINVRVKDYPSIEKVNEKVPAWLGKVVRKATSRDPEKRYPTVDEFLDDLTLRNILSETDEEVDAEDDGEEVEVEYLEDIQPRRKSKKLEYFEVAFIIISFVVVIAILVHTLSPARLALREEEKNTATLRGIIGDVEQQERLNPQGFDIRNFIAAEYKGDAGKAFNDYIQIYSLSIHVEDVYIPGEYEGLEQTGTYRRTYTVVAYPRDEFNPDKLRTFALREDHVVHVWSEGYKNSKLEDVSSWKVKQ